MKLSFAAALFAVAVSANEAESATDAESFKKGPLYAHK